MKRLTVGSYRDFLGRLRTVIAGLVCLAGVLGAGAATHKITVSGGFLDDGEATTLSGLEVGAEVSAYIDQSKCLDKNEMFVNDFAHWTYTPATADLGEGFDPFSQEVTVTMPDADVKLTANFVNGFAAYIYCASGYMDGDDDGLPEGEFYWSVDNGKSLIPFGHEFANGGYPVKPGTVTVKFYDKTGNWRAGDWTYTVEKRGTYKEGSTTYYLDPAYFYLSSVRFVPVTKSTAVKLDANGGSGSKETFQVEGYRFGALPIATRKGYVFAGWWTQKDGGEHVTEDKIFQAADFAGQKTPTIYAHWLQLRKLTLKETKGASPYAYWYVEPEHFDGDYQLYSEIAASYFRMHPELEDDGNLYGYPNEKGVMELLPGAQVYVEASDEIVDKNGKELVFQKWSVTPSKVDMGATFFASESETDLTMPDADVSLQPTYIDGGACGSAYGYASASSINLGWDEESESDVYIYPPTGAFEWSPDGGKTWYKAEQSGVDYYAPGALLKEGKYTITWRSTDPHWVTTTDKEQLEVWAYETTSTSARFTYVPEITVDVMTIGGSSDAPSSAPGGTATMNPKDGLVFPKKAITLTAKAAKDYAFQGWALAKYWEYGDSFKNTDATWKLENYTYVDMCGDGESYLNNYIDPTDKKVHVVAVFKALSAYSEDDISFDGFEGSDTYNGVGDDGSVTIKAVVGCALDDDLALDCGPLASPLAYKLNGKLPDGLKFDAKKGVLSGAPKKPGNTSVTITATDPAKNAKNLTVNFIVNPLPDWLVGEFRGIMSEEKYVPGYWDWDDEAQEDVWVDGEYLPSQQNGILELSVKSDGKVSAKVLTQLGTRSVSGTLTWRDPETYDGDDDDEGEFAEFRFWHEDAKDESYCHVRFYSDGTIDGYVDSYDKKEDDWFGGNMVGMRQDTELLEQSPFLDKYYTFAFCATTKESGERWDDELQDYVPDESEMKSGYGYLTLKTDKKGVAKVAGQLPDGEKVSMSALVMPCLIDSESEPTTDNIAARLYLFASPSSYKKLGWFAMQLMLIPDGLVVTEEGAAWNTSSGGGDCGKMCSPGYGGNSQVSVSGEGALYSAAATLEDYYWNVRCAWSDDVRQQYSYKYLEENEDNPSKPYSWTEYGEEYAKSFDGYFFNVAVKGDSKGAISLIEKSPAPWEESWREDGVTYKEWNYWVDKNGNEIADPSQLSISFTKATGIFTGKATVYFDYEQPSCKQNSQTKEIEWSYTMKHATATLPYAGVMIATENEEGKKDYRGLGAAVHTYKYSYTDENNKAKTETEKISLPVSLESAQADDEEP